MRIGAMWVGVALLAAAPAVGESPRSGSEPRVRDVRVAEVKPAPPAGHRGSPRSGGHSGYGGRHGYGGHYRGHGGIYLGGGWGHGYGYGGWYGYPYYRGWGPWWYGPTWGYGYTTAYPRAGWKQGALDIDISPERAEVWVDGQRVGVADDFDGFPDYLWLPEGTYDVVFFSEGRQTLARQYSIYAGLVVDVEDRLLEGDAVHPLDLGPKTNVRRDERLRRDRETRENAERMEREWAEEERRGDEPESLDARGEPGRIALTVAPDDASVYLDGRFLGSGRELARLRAGLLVDPGAHRLEVVRPGYRSVGLDVSVEEGEEERLDLELEREAEAGDSVR